MKNIKEILYNECQLFIENRFRMISHSIKTIQNSLALETKNSAGDKHETGRAMLQLEREKVGKQLAEIQKTKVQLTKISITKSSKIISLGSVIYTDKGNYFMSISAGAIAFQNEQFYAISPKTPLGQLLLSKKEGDSIVFRENVYMILSII